MYPFLASLQSSLLGSSLVGMIDCTMILDGPLYVNPEFKRRSQGKVWIAEEFSRNENDIRISFFQDLQLVRSDEEDIHHSLDFLP